jgi:hypothetical protein
VEHSFELVIDYVYNSLFIYLLSYVYNRVSVALSVEEHLDLYSLLTAKARRIRTQASSIYCSNGY